MAERRMFHTAVVGSDDFLDLPVGAQALYFHLGMRADDDGFVNGPRQIARTIRRPPRELSLLVEKGFLLDLDGVMVLTHWLVANSLKADRLKPPQYPSLAARLYINEDRSYTTRPLENTDSLLVRRNKILESKRNPKVREDKLTEDKITKDKVRQGSVTEAAGAADCAHARDADRALKIMGGKLGKGVVLLSDQEQEDLLERLGIDGFDKYVEKLAAFILANNASVNNHYATILKWWQEDRGT